MWQTITWNKVNPPKLQRNNSWADSPRIRQQPEVDYPRVGIISCNGAHLNKAPLTTYSHLHNNTLPPTMQWGPLLMKSIPTFFDLVRKKTQNPNSSQLI